MSIEYGSRLFLNGRFMWSTYFFLGKFTFCDRLIFLRQIYIADLRLLTDFFFMKWQTFSLCDSRLFVYVAADLLTKISVYVQQF